MKKNKGMAYAVLAIAFVLFNVIAFAVPTAKTATFWIAYVFTVIAFDTILQIEGLRAYLGFMRHLTEHWAIGN